MAIDEPPGGAARSALSPAFPQRNAFVLQFATDSGPRTGLFHGRVEHVASGRQAVFGSFDELRRFVGEVLLASNEPAVPAAGDG
jgi:hypothetical protein